MLVLCLEELTIRELVSNQLLISLDQVVVMVDHNSAKETLVVLVIEVVGFEVLINDINYIYKIFLGIKRGLGSSLFRLLK